MPVAANPRMRRWLPWIAVCLVALYLARPSLTQPESPAPKDKPAGPRQSSYDQVSPVILGQETFEQMMAKDKAGKDAVIARQKKLLEERYDLSVHVDKRITMSRGKPVPVGPTAKLPEDWTWDKLAAMPPEEIRDKNVFPKGYLPLPHPNHPVGGMLFPQME